MVLGFFVTLLRATSSSVPPTGPHTNSVDPSVHGTSQLSPRLKAVEPQAPAPTRSGRTGPEVSPRVLGTSGAGFRSVPPTGPPTVEPDSAHARPSRDDWLTLVRDRPACVLAAIVDDEFVPFSARRALEERGLFDLNSATYGITEAGFELLHTIGRVCGHRRT